MNDMNYCEKVWVCTFSPSKKARGEWGKLGFRKNELKSARFVRAQPKPKYFGQNQEPTWK